MSDLIRLSARMRVDTERKDDWIIATCPLLHVVSQGQSVDQAVERVREEIQALINIAIERGVLHEMLQHRFALAKQLQARSAAAGPNGEFHWVVLDLPIEAIHELAQAA